MTLQQEGQGKFISEVKDLTFFLLCHHLNILLNYCFPTSGAWIPHFMMPEFQIYIENPCVYQSAQLILLDSLLCCMVTSKCTNTPDVFCFYTLVERQCTSLLKTMGIV